MTDPLFCPHDELELLHDWRREGDTNVFKRERCPACGTVIKTGDLPERVGMTDDDDDRIADPTIQ